MFETRFNKSHSISKNLLLIKGLGQSKINIMCKALGINPQLRLKSLSKTHTEKLYSLLSKFKKQSHLDYVLQDINPLYFSSPANNYSFIREQLSPNKLDDINETLIFFINKKATYTYFHSFYLTGSDSTHLYSKEGRELENKLDRNIIIDESLEEYEKTNITSLVATNTYRGRRLKLGYPSRGQRTRTNARTARRLNKRFLFKKN
jgi:ribosomal protein S13